MTAQAIVAPSTSESRTGLPSRGICRTAHLIPFTVVPAALWRFALGFGIPVGFTGPMTRLYHAPGWITLYVTGLNLLSEGLALLTLGLIRPWGEVVPRWIPLIGGRRIPVLAATIPAAMGALALMVISVIVVFGWNDGAGTDPDYAYYPHGLAACIMTGCYAPYLLWGPLLAVVTGAYYLRRTRTRKGNDR